MQMKSRKQDVNYSGKHQIFNKASYFFLGDATATNIVTGTKLGAGYPMYPF